MMISTEGKRSEDRGGWPGCGRKGYDERKRKNEVKRVRRKEEERKKKRGKMMMKDG